MSKLKLTYPYINDRCNSCESKKEDGNCKKYKVHCGAVITCLNYKSKEEK